MKFYGREEEILELAKIRDISQDTARFTIVTGRRRVGKTELLDHALNDGKTPYLYMHLIEQRKFKGLRSMVEEDYDSFSGYSLEQYFKEKFLSEGAYTRIGGWWDRKGENEIDLVCENEFSGQLDFYEVKIDSARYSEGALLGKMEAFFRKHPEMRSRRHGHALLSLRDM